MAFTCVWRLALLFSLFCVPLTEEFRLEIHRRLTSDILRMFDSIGSNFPVHCRDQGMKTKALVLRRIATKAKTEDRIRIVFHVLQHISDIYRTNVSSMIWNKNEMEHFKTVLHQQLDELVQDLKVRLSNSKMIGKKRIYKYFSKLKAFLQNQSYSQCAWEIIRIETRRIIQNIFKLLE